MPSDALSRPGRLRALRETALLDSPPEAAFDRLTRLASMMLGVPVSLVSLIDADRQFFKSAHGLPEPWASRRETPLSHSFCQHVVAQEAPLIVEDARLEPLLRDNEAIDDIGVIAYAGFPIMSSDGEVIGSLCAIDDKPRYWSATDLEMLRELAGLAHTELALRAALRETDAEARHAERAMAERTAVIESSSDGIYTVDVHGRCTLVNEAAAILLGYSSDEMHGANMHELVHHHHADGTAFPEAECPLYRAFREAATIRVDGTVFWRKDGASFPAECTSSPLFLDGQIAGAVVSFRDVSERIAASAALRETAEAMRLLADAGAILASSLEYETTLQSVARLALPLLGDACLVDLQPGDGTHQTLCAHVDPERERAFCAAPIASALAAFARVGERDDDARAADRIVDVQRARATAGDLDAASLDQLTEYGIGTLVGVPLRGRRGLLGTLAFMAEQRRYTAADVRLIEELAARAASVVENALLYREAQRATRARDEMLAVVSHDLRNPVHTISMAASLLIEFPELDQSTMQAQLGVIRRSAARANRLIQDLLDVTRIEHGELPLDRHWVHAAEVIAEAAQMVSAQALERNIAIAVTAPPSELAVDADRHRLLQVLDNLLGNALKFTPSGGSIALEVSAVKDGAQFVVRDTGPGVLPEEQANLFRRFWQARRTDRRGVGLGLSIVKGIVDAHGGRIDVESDGRSGTTFQFTIPDRAATSSETAP